MALSALPFPKLSSLIFPSAFPNSNLFPPGKTLIVSPREFRFPKALSSTDDDGHVIGDCLVFEDGVFLDPFLQDDAAFGDISLEQRKRQERQDTKRKKKSERKIRVKAEAEVEEGENLVPEEWRHIQEEVNITKKERRRIAQELEFGLRVEKKRQALVPLRDVDLKEYLSYKEEKLAQLKPLLLDNPTGFPVKDEDDDDSSSSSSQRVVPKNPRWAAYGKGFDYVTDFFNSENYEPGGGKKSHGPRKLFTKEEKVLLNSRIPDLAVATSSKWLPLHTLAASGEFYLVDSLLKHNVDINAADKNGLTALHRAIIGKKQAVTSYLLRESANPFALDEEGATLIHYAVQTASAPAVKLLLLYKVDMNHQDNDGWTPLHVAVQARRSDMVKLLLIKGADRTLRNKDGLTPLDLCLYSGHETRTYELIKLLKQFPSRRKNAPGTHQASEATAA